MGQEKSEKKNRLKKRQVITVICFDQIVNFTSWLKDVGDVVVAFFGVYCAYQGVSYIRTLKEKRVSATFSYWTQLSVHLSEIKSFLEAHENVLNGLYSNEVRAAWLDVDGALDKDIHEFISMVEGTLAFLKNTPDQMPAYSGWVSDYMKLTDFLINVSQHDISNMDVRFLFTDPEKYGDISARKSYCKSIITVINRLLGRIKKHQMKMSKEIWTGSEER